MAFKLARDGQEALSYCLRESVWGTGSILKVGVSRWD